MPLTIIDYKFGAKRLGVSFRPTRRGPELELVEWFLGANRLPAPYGCRVTVFREPRLESGFPDLVAVVWQEAVAQTWEPSRAALTTADLRLMQYLVQQESCTALDLKALFGVIPCRGLTRLEDAGMVRSQGSSWVARPLSQIFAVRDILAIEAKVADWCEALDQAHLNTWFASASYVLVPRLPKKKSLVDAAVTKGIGIWAKEGPCQQSCRLLRRIPCSYASWLFNEWVWRAARLESCPALGFSA